MSASLPFDASVFEKNAEAIPQGQRVVDGRAHHALWQMAATVFPVGQDRSNAIDDGPALGSCA